MATRSGGCDTQVSIAIVSWNTRTLLSACLESLRDDVKTGVADVWVVDNASSDGSPELVAAQFSWAHLIRSSENLGFGRAVNLVAQRTTTKWIAPANADIRLSDAALTRLVSEGERHPEAAVIAPRLLLPDGSTQHSAYPFPTIPFTLAYVLGVTALSERVARHWCIGRGFDPERPREVPWAIGAFMLVRRSAWDEVGGFDGEQWMYAEDLDLGWRLRRAGWTARYLPDARVFHAESASTTLAWGEARHVRWHVSTYMWLRRRRGTLVALLLAAINIVGFLARAAAASPGALCGSNRLRNARENALRAARLHALGLRRRDALERLSSADG